MKDAKIWEDGLRTDPTKKSFEWWYFDANFTDGTTIVTTFFTKQPSNAAGKPNPQVSVVVTSPDGKKLSFNKYYSYSDFGASKEKCDVTIGPNSLNGDLKNYVIKLDLPGLSGEIEFKRVAPSYSTARTDTSKPEYFGWFPAIPYGNVKAKLTVQGEKLDIHGTGYHDHNWGIINIKDVCQYWYWGRGKADDYYMIFTVMVLPKILGGKHASILYLAKDDKILIGDSANMDLEKTNIMPPAPKVGHLPTELTFLYNNGSEKVEFTLTNPKIIEQLDPLNDEPKWKKFISRIFSKPWYIRYNSDMQLDMEFAGKKISKKGNSLYEIMILK